MGKWQLGIIGAFLLVYSLTVLLTGNAEYLVVTALLAAIVLAYAGLNVFLARRMADRHGGSLEEAMADETETIPAAHLITDDSTPVGDTPEAHDEINPHDLPRDAPGRHAAEAQAAQQGGTTGGHEEGAGGSGGRFARQGGAGAQDEPVATPRPGGVTRPLS